MSRVITPDGAEKYAIESSNATFGITQDAFRQVKAAAARSIQPPTSLKTRTATFGNVDRRLWTSPGFVDTAEALNQPE
jgi:hypothetical protein